MVRKMLQNVKSWWGYWKKKNNLIVKLGIGLVLLGICFRMLYSRSSGFEDVSEDPFIIRDNAESSAHTVFSNAPDETYDVPSKVATLPEERGGKCDIFDGNWIPNPAGPVYSNDTCNIIEKHQNCMTNGREDTGYLYWRWSPRDCELPQLDAERFLEIMRNKRWALIGDSISRNHVQSLLCILSKVEEAVLVYHDEGWKSRRWLFPSYNFTISVIWSPFLAEAAIYEDINGVSTHDVELHLDKLDMNWTALYQSLDYVIFSSGKWYVKSAIYYEHNKEVGCHKCTKRKLTELEYGFAYRKVLNKVFNHVIASNHKGVTFYRTSTPDHFENGTWSTGGTCKRTEPAKEGDFELSELNQVLHKIELEEFRKASAKASKKGVKLKLFDVTSLSLLRPDGHPGPYRFFQPFVKDRNAKVINDCLHWCLPGPIDSWNDLLMEMVVNG
ncbi:hypothetical protein Leryth_008953 [Lithospermum erythrorhizon]|uniref:Trichome birefringence-like N-terminal domain-containing protein n=1 Tax=Lithospermum erythrorhizon TaxID=34254 RepID=A0AAV3P010_LITER|nr:hypothetical protein Leryth_008953 [Lithospermum erythrorhizon]